MRDFLSDFDSPAEKSTLVLQADAVISLSTAHEAAAESLSAATVSVSPPQRTAAVIAAR